MGTPSTHGEEKKGGLGPFRLVAGWLARVKRIQINNVVVSRRNNYYCLACIIYIFHFTASQAKAKQSRAKQKSKQASNSIYTTFFGFGFFLLPSCRIFFSMFFSSSKFFKSIRSAATPCRVAMCHASPYRKILGSLEVVVMYGCSFRFGLDRLRGCSS